MTVKELIEKLQQYPDKFEVVVDTDSAEELSITEEDVEVCQENKQLIIIARDYV